MEVKSQTSEDWNGGKKKVFCPLDSDCPDWKNCEYKIHHCLKMKKTKCDDFGCDFQHDCYWGKTCKNQANGNCKLNHYIECKNKPCKYGDKCFYEHVNVQNSKKYCEKEDECLHRFHCCFPHKLNYWLKAFQKFKDDRTKQSAIPCELFQAVESNRKCHGFNCGFDHSSPRFKDIYETVAKYFKTCKEMSEFEKFYDKSDIHTIEGSKKKRSMCNYGVKCKLLVCDYAHTVEDHVQKIIHNCLTAMKLEIAEFLAKKKVSEKAIKAFLYGSIDPQPLGRSSFEDHTNYYTKTLPWLKEFIKKLKLDQIRRFPPMDVVSFPHLIEPGFENEIEDEDDSESVDKSHKENTNKEAVANAKPVFVAPKNDDLPKAGDNKKLDELKNIKIELEDVKREMIRRDEKIEHLEKQLQNLRKENEKILKTKSLLIQYYASQKESFLKIEKQLNKKN